jgi:hypothetical protein
MDKHCHVKNERKDGKILKEPYEVEASCMIWNQDVPIIELLKDQYDD